MAAANDWGISNILDAARSIREDTQIENQRLHQLAQEEQQRDELFLRQQQQEAAQAEIARKQAQEERQSSLLRSAYASQVPQNIAKEDISGDLSLAYQTKQAAQNLLKQGLNPTLANNLLKQSEDLEGSSFRKQKAQDEVMELKAERTGLLMSTIGSQAELDQAIPLLFKDGVVVPEQYQTYNPKTAEWLERRSLQSKKVIAGRKVANEIQDLDFKERKFKEEQKLAEAKEKRLADKEAHQQNNIAIQRAIKPTTKTEVEQEMVILSEDDKFSDLDDADRLNAAQSIQYLARSLVANGRARDLDTAKAMARNQIRNRIDEDGNYIPLDVSAPSAETIDWKAKLGAKYKPGYRYWIEGGRIKGEPQ